MSAQKPMEGSTWATVFTVEGEISRGRSSHVVRIVLRGLLQEPSVRRESGKSDGAEAKSLRGSSLIGGTRFDGHSWVQLYQHASSSSHAGKQARLRDGNREIGTQTKGKHLMKTITKSKSMHRGRAFLLAICAGVVATFMVGCAEGPYVTAYDSGYYYPTTYYAPAYPYSYYDYGPTYERTTVRSGTRYNDAYGPRYYGSTTYGDWY